MIEKVWIPITNITSNEISKFVKKECYFMKNISVCFFMAEIDVITNNNIQDTIIIDIPELSYNFAPCENTVLSRKILNDGEIINSIVQIRLENQKLIITGFGFEKETKYEFNIQFFMRVKDNLYLS